MENFSPPRRRTRAGQRAAEDAEKLEEQRNFEACPWVLMVGKGEEVRQRRTDRVQDERRRKLDSIERGEGVPPVKKEMLEEENILEKCEENRQESDEENEDVDIKEEATDCDEDCNFQDQNKLPEGAVVALEMDWLQEMEMKEEEEHQDQGISVGEEGAGREGLIMIDHEEEESGMDDAQAVIGNQNKSNGGEVDQIGQQKRSTQAKVERNKNTMMRIETTRAHEVGSPMLMIFNYARCPMPSPITERAQKEQVRMMFQQLE